MIMKKFMKGFVYAFRGLVKGVCEELNMMLHLVAAAVVTIVGLYVGLEQWEWVAVVLSMGLVLSLELLNTAVEGLVDMISPEWSEKAGRIKDFAAGAVLVAALAALVVGVLVFGPKFF